MCRLYRSFPDDLQNIQVDIPYIGIDGASYNATITASLEYTVTSATANESLESIKFNAPLVYASQNRMITDQDYSIYPLSVSSSVIKTKAINRTHSGHSRYFDLYDPTGNYDNLNIFGEDGYLYQEYIARRKTFSTNTVLTSEQIVDTIIKDLLEDSSTKNFYYNKYDTTNTALDLGVTTASTSISWSAVGSNNTSSNGFFSVPANYSSTSGEFTAV